MLCPELDYPLLYEASMNSITITALRLPDVQQYASHSCSKQIRNTNCVLSSTIRRVDTRGDFPNHRSCGCKRQQIMTHAQQHSGASTKLLKETAALDQLIDLFLGAKSQQQVRGSVAQLRSTRRRVIPVSAAFQRLMLSILCTAGQACCGQHPQLGPKVLAETGNSK